MERYSLHKYFYIASKKSHESQSQYFENPENNTVSTTNKKEYDDYLSFYNMICNEPNVEYKERSTKDASTQTWEETNVVDDRYKNNYIFGYSDEIRKTDLDMNIVKDFLANGYDLTAKDYNLNTAVSAYFKRDIMNLEMIDILNDYLTMKQRSSLVHVYLLDHKKFDYPFFKKLVLTNKHCLKTYYCGDFKGFTRIFYGTPLHVLASLKSLITPNYMKLLVYNGNDINAMNENTPLGTPLHYYLHGFTRSNFLDYNETIIDTFIELGADIIMPNERNRIPVITAIHNINNIDNIQNIKILRKLLILSKHAKPELFRDFVMHDYIKKSYIDTECLDIIRSLDGFDINKYYNGYTPLHYAIKYNTIHTAKYLLDNGADMTLRTHNNKTIFYLALRVYGARKWTSFLISRLPPKELLGPLTDHIIDCVLMNKVQDVWEGSPIVISYLILMVPSFYSKFKKAIEFKIHQRDDILVRDTEEDEDDEEEDDEEDYEYCYMNNIYYDAEDNYPLNDVYKDKYMKVLQDAYRYNSDVMLLKSIYITDGITIYNILLNNNIKIPVYGNYNKELIAESNIYHDIVKDVISGIREKFNLMRKVIYYIDHDQPTYLNTIPKELVMEIFSNMNLLEIRDLYTKYYSATNTAIDYIGCGSQSETMIHVQTQTHE
ncbi:ankyrin-containing protein [Akhmeta virus]|uniref:Ankyrin-containing protein n=2 Tax=Orthopoxvirus akhmetapox TaxID=2200830 RepID=A0A346FRA0_9POXV|nr:ankyrin-containing protein [Akhmeta virus]AXN74793.1 ankyrin-containing protein [Akhmeta virus]AXN75013.1 ankyrin-containing protein [Akhmeta virus]